jgi:hypothetical protein
MKDHITHHRGLEEGAGENSIVSAIARYAVRNQLIAP